MKNLDHLPHPVESQQEVLPSKQQDHFSLDRRRFLKLTGSGLVIVFSLSDLISFAGKTSSVKSSYPPGDVAAWIHIGEAGTVTVFTGKVEVGQNIRTSLAQMVAEELMVPVSSIKMIMGDTDLVPWDAGTFGSRTTPQMGFQLRKAAATARIALIEMAAKKWDTPVTDLTAENGAVVNSTRNRKAGYGELTRGQQLIMPISDNVALIAAKDWKVAGTSVPKINERDFITGKHIYVSD